MDRFRGNICFLANAASIHTQRWANYFAEHDWKVELITWHSPAKDSKMLEGVKVHRVFFPPHYIARYGTLLEIARMMKNIRPDIIHAHYLSHFGIMGALYSRFFNFKPLVLTAWGGDVLKNIEGWRGWSLKWLVKYAIRRADVITCDAEHMIQVLVRLGAAPEKVELIYFGTDIQKFQPAPKDQELLTKLAINDSPTVISLRSLLPLYDIESLIRALPMVLKDAPAAKFIIAGDGPQKEYLQELAVELGVAHSSSFVGNIASDELPRYLNSADIYVSTSLSDAGLAASTAEAMACGLPVIITDFGDNGKWVEDGVNGFVVPLRNPEVLATRIIDLLQNEDKRRQFGKAGRQVIEERNNREREMDKMEQLYSTLIEKYGK